MGATGPGTAENRPAGRPRRPLLSHDVHYGFLRRLEAGRVDDGRPEQWRRWARLPLFWTGLEGRRFSHRRLLQWLTWTRSARSLRQAASMFRCSRRAGALRIASGEFSKMRTRSTATSSARDRVWTNDEYEQELFWWRCCLQSGDAMAHFGLGFTLSDLARFTRPCYFRASRLWSLTWVWLGRCSRVSAVPNRRGLLPEGDRAERSRRRGGEPDVARRNNDSSAARRELAL
jgi:hypothetical protein